MFTRDFPSGPVVKSTLQRREPGSNPGWGTKIPRASGQLSLHGATKTQSNQINNVLFCFKKRKFCQYYFMNYHEHFRILWHQDKGWMWNCGLNWIFALFEDILKQYFATFWPNLERNTLVYVVCCCSVPKLWLTLCNPVDYNTPGSSVLHYLLEFA